MWWQKLRQRYVSTKIKWDVLRLLKQDCISREKGPWWKTKRKEWKKTRQDKCEWMTATLYVFLKLAHSPLYKGISLTNPETSNPKYETVSIWLNAPWQPSYIAQTYLATCLTSLIWSNHFTCGLIQSTFNWSYLASLLWSLCFHLCLPILGKIYVRELIYFYHCHRFKFSGTGNHCGWKGKRTFHENMKRAMVIRKSGDGPSQKIQRKPNNNPPKKPNPKQQN